MLTGASTTTAERPTCTDLVCSKVGSLAVIHVGRIMFDWFDDCWCGWGSEYDGRQPYG